jgi:hypothetical protein
VLKRQDFASCEPINSDWLFTRLAKSSRWVEDEGTGKAQGGTFGGIVREAASDLALRLINGPERSFMLKRFHGRR